MKIRVPVRDFRAAFAIAGRFVASGKLAPPIATYVQLDATGDDPTMVAHDPPKGLGCRVPIEGAVVDDPGIAMLPRLVVDQILKSADDDLATIQLNGLELRIKVGSAQWKFPTIDPATFPVPAGWDGDADLVLPAGMVGVVHDRVRSFFDPLSTRFALGGSFVTWGGGVASFAVSDGRKAAIQALGCDTASTNTETPTIVPGDFLGLLAAIFPLKSGPIELRIAPRSIVARVGRIVASSNLLEGRFPAVGADTLGTGSGSSVYLEDADAARAFRQAFVQAAAIKGIDDTSSIIAATFGPGTLALVARAGESGTSEVDLAIPFRGEPITAGYLPQHFLTALEAVGDMPVTISPDPKQPTYIETLDGYRAWICPVTLEATK